MVDKLRKHLLPLEGWRDAVYLDINGHPTAGMGHLLKGDEIQKYPVGSTVPKSILNKWTNDDLQWALDAGKDAANDIGMKWHTGTVITLSSTAYQLGPYWRNKFPQIWSLAVAGKYFDAAEKISSTSWMSQTPSRAKELQEALKKIPRLKTSKVVAIVVLSSLVAISATFAVLKFVIKKP